MSHVCNHMDMIGHHNEAASEPTVTRWAVEQERSDSSEGLDVVEDTGAAIHAQSQKVGNIAIAIWPNAMQTAKAAWRRFFSGEAVWGHTAYRGGVRRLVGRVP